MYKIEVGQPSPFPVRPQGEGTELILSDKGMLLLMHISSPSAREKRAWTETLQYGIIRQGTVAALLFRLREADDWAFEAYVVAPKDSALAIDYVNSKDNVLIMCMIDIDTNTVAARTRLISLDAEVVKEMRDVILLQTQVAIEQIEKDIDVFMSTPPEDLFKNVKRYTHTR